MDQSSTLYFSTFQIFETCPQKFLWSRGWQGIDLGNGPGRKKTPPLKDSRHHAMMGTVIGKVIENLYNDELWKHPKGLVESLVKMTEREFAFELERTYIDWRLAQPKAEMLEVCKTGVVNYLRTMKMNRFLGPYSKAEVELLGWIDKWNPVAGRADLIIRRDDTGVTILDLKNAKDKGKYTDPDQLRWYALCYYLAYGKLPDRVGFVYLRHPYTEEDGKVLDTGVTWVTCTKEDIKGLALRAVEARKKMRKQQFEPTPSPSGCKFCEYETVCEARIQQKAANSRGRKKADEKIDTGGGFVNIGLLATPPGKKNG